MDIECVLFVGMVFVWYALYSRHIGTCKRFTQSQLIVYNVWKTGTVAF